MLPSRGWEDSAFDVRRVLPTRCLDQAVFVLQEAGFCCLVVAGRAWRYWPRVQVRARAGEMRVDGRLGT